MVAALTKRIRLTRGLLVASLIVSMGASAHAQRAGGSSRQIDEVLRKAVEEQRLPGVVAMVAEGDAVVYQGAFGKQYTTQGVPMAADSIFRIASMTKAVTSVAVMQLVERGRVKLDEPAGTYLPELSRVEVLEDFDANGTPKLRPPKTPVTVRQLLTHTSGFGYEFFDEKLSRYVAAGRVPSALTGDGGFLKAPLLFDPGTRWEYGISIDWLGKLVEKISGQSLEEYFRQNIFAPLSMEDSFFNVPADKQARVVTVHQRKDDGTLVENPPEVFKPAQFLSGGGGLYSTAPDYLKFTRMLLGGGTLGQTRVLQPETVALMGRNQIGDLTLTPIRSLAPQFARNGVPIPGLLDKFGLGFAINTQPVAGGRASGSLAWAGIYNTFFWIDPARKTTAVLMMQLLPFMDDAAKALLEEFELAVYGPQVRQAPPVQPQPHLVSPEVHPDHSVTFRFRHPNAKEVLLAREGAEPVPMRKDEQGVWSFTTDPLEPDLYGYSFVADGVRLADPSNPLMKPNLLFTPSMVHVRGSTSLPWEINDVPHGVIHHHFYHSSVVGDDRDFYVYTPPGYDGKKVYPVLYLLHGFSDDASAWTAVGRAHVILDNLIAQGKAKPALVVMPLGYGAPEMLSLAFGAFRDPNLVKQNMDKFREALLTEIIPQVEKSYRASRDRRSRAIAGLSMGGAESLYVGLNTLDRFGWVGAFSSGGLAEDFSAEFPALDVEAGKQLRLLWVACGTDDHLISLNRKFRDWLKSKGIPHTDIETPGAHTWMVWRRNLASFVSLLFQP